MTEQIAQPCIGIMGRLFGHKFLKSRGGYLHISARCFRCGMLVEGDFDG